MNLADIATAQSAVCELLRRLRSEEIIEIRRQFIKGDITSEPDCDIFSAVARLRRWTTGDAVRAELCIPDDSAIDRLLLGLQPGDTPNNSTVAASFVAWCNEVLAERPVPA